MIRPELSKFSALLKQISSQVGPLNLIADLVVQRPFSLQETLRMNFRNPVHECRPKAVHDVSQGHLVAAGLIQVQSPAIRRSAAHDAAAFGL